MGIEALISIIVVNYNGSNFIYDCINSILESDYSNFEIIFVDNKSLDNSLDIIKENFKGNKHLKIIANGENFGASKGRNIGVKYAKGSMLVFLDNDTKVDSLWLKKLVNILNSDKAVGAAQAKLLLLDRKAQIIDACGHFLSPFGFPYEIGVNEEDKGQYDKVTNIFGARSAAMIIRKEVFDNVGGFDSDYFIYGEETDLCWRIWLSGYRVVFAPMSIVYHYGGGTLTQSSNYRILYEGSKNNIKNLIKNLGLCNLLVILPVHIGCWLIMSFIFLLKGRFKSVKNIFKGISWHLFNFKRSYRDRLRVQCNIRKVSDSYLMPIIFGKLSLKALFKKGFAWLGRI